MATSKVKFALAVLTVAAIASVGALAVAGFPHRDLSIPLTEQQMSSLYGGVECPCLQHWDEDCIDAGSIGCPESVSPEACAGGGIGDCSRCTGGGIENRECGNGQCQYFGVACAETTENCPAGSTPGFCSGNGFCTGDPAGTDPHLCEGGTYTDC